MHEERHKMGDGKKVSHAIHSPLLAQINDQLRVSDDDENYNDDDDAVYDSIYSYEELYYNMQILH